MVDAEFEAVKVVVLGRWRPVGEVGRHCGVSGEKAKVWCKEAEEVEGGGRTIEERRFRETSTP